MGVVLGRWCQDVTGAFDDPINDMCAGNADLWVETKRRTKRGAYGEVHTTYAYTFSFKDASNGETGAPGGGAVRFRG